MQTNQQGPRTRRVQRVHFAQPMMARLGATPVVLVDLSLLGARLEHHTPVPSSGSSRLTFRWDEREIVLECRIVRSRLERFSVGSDGLTVYHSGVEFHDLPEELRGTLKTLIGAFIARALEEQKLNARGVMPEHEPAKMPIFSHGGQLTSNGKDRAAGGSPTLPISRVAKESGFVCYQLERGMWRKKRTQDPAQPPNGFTISALEDNAQAKLLCDTYLRADDAGRKMIQLCAQLSIVDGEGIAPGRFEP
jgi:hypothetical protein